VFEFSSQNPYQRAVKSVFEVPVFKTDGRHDRFWFGVFVKSRMFRNEVILLKVFFLFPSWNEMGRIVLECF